MTLKSTIFKADIQIADMNRHYYKSHSLTVARHPSETDERMMVRLLAFAINASEELQFTKGLSTDDEPALWRKNYTDDIELWIDVGLPDEKRIRKATQRASQVIIYAYGGNAATVWWQQIHTKLSRFANLTIYNLAESSTQGLTKLTARTMQLNCTIQDEQIWLANATNTIEITPATLFQALS